MTQDAVRGPQEPAEALATGVSAVRSIAAYESLQEAVRQLYSFIVTHLDPEPGPVEEYFPSGTPSNVVAEALVAVGEANWQYQGLAGSEVPEVSPEVEAALREQEEADRAAALIDPVTKEEVDALLDTMPEPQRSFLRGVLDGMGEDQ